MFSGVDPGMNFQNFHGFSKILSEVVDFTDPAPKKLLHIIMMRINSKKSGFYHISFVRQIAIYISKNNVVTGVDPGDEYWKF